MNEQVIFRSEVNGITFDSVNGTTNHLLSSHKKSQFVKPEKTEKSGRANKGGKAKVSIGTENNEQEIS